MAENRQTRPVTLVLVALAAIAVSMIAGQVLAVLMMPSLSCQGLGCRELIFSDRFSLTLVQSLLCAAALLVFLITRPQNMRQTGAARLWPLYLLVLVVAIGSILSLALAEYMRQTLSSGWHFTRLSVEQRVIWVLLARPPLMVLITVLVAVFAVLATCFTPSNKAASSGLSRARSAFMLYLFLAALMSTLLIWLHANALLSRSYDYSRMTGEFREEMGVSFGWALWWLSVLMTLPAWPVGYWAGRAGQGPLRVLVTGLVTLVLGATLGVMVFAVDVLYLWDRYFQVGSSVITFIGLLLAYALATWLALRIVLAGGGGGRSGDGARSRLVLTAASVVVVLYTTNLVWRVLAGEFEWGGTRPESQKIATEMADYQISNGHCSGVVVEGDRRWLVAVKEDYQYNRALRDLPDADFLLEKVPPTAHQQPEYQVYASYGTVVSRQVGDRFQVVTYLPGKACLLPLPAAGKVLLLTSYQREGELSRGKPSHGKVVFASTDQGRHWHEADAAMLSRLIRDEPGIGVARVAPGELWAWGDGVYPDAARGAGSGFGFSGDGGRTDVPLPIPETFPVSLADMISRIPEGEGSSPSAGVVRRHVTPLSPDKALLWRSQRFPYGDDGQALLRTDVMVMQREQGRWQAGEVRHLDGLFIRRLEQSPSGPAYALLEREDEPQPVLARLEDGHWEELSPLPDPFWPFGDELEVKGFWATADTLLVKVWGAFRIPFDGGGYDNLETARAYYFSTDQGDSWQKLDMDHLFGLIGTSAEADMAFVQGYLKDGNTRAILGFRFGEADGKEETEK